MNVHEAFLLFGMLGFKRIFLMKGPSSLTFLSYFNLTIERRAVKDYIGA